MRDFFATMLALVIIVGTVWGVLALLSAAVNAVSFLGVPKGLLYFSAGLCFAVSYRNIGRWFADYCDTVWSKISAWIMFR
ncbi:MAG TPA: hypothetical protein EYQ00_08290 [Dehalococcoidia bacterium]|nr:hypothetical protein [Dehalococcoidia bacterium]